MNAATLAIILAATSLDRMSLHDGNGDCFAIVRIENRAGAYNQIETLETSRGLVSIRYQTIGGHNAADDDRIEVVSLPDGVFARPMESAIVDGESIDICLYEFLGG